MTVTPRCFWIGAEPCCFIASLLPRGLAQRRFRRTAGAVSDWAESETALDSISGRIFYGEPAPTSPENALIAAALRPRAPPQGGEIILRDDCGRDAGGVALNFTSLDPVNALYWSAVVNGVVAAPLMAS
jgi:hypothetical protein